MVAVCKFANVLLVQLLVRTISNPYTSNLSLSLSLSLSLERERGYTYRREEQRGP